MILRHSVQSRLRLLSALASLAVLIILLMWMQGVFGDKVRPGTTAAPEAGSGRAGGTAVVERRRIDEVFAWPGTVAARTVARIAPKVPGRIAEIAVRAGDRVRRGQVLAKLDETEIRARLGQARAALAGAEAQAERTGADARRIRNLYEKEAATRQDLDAAAAAARSAAAGAREARDAVRAAESQAGESVLAAPFDGVVVERHREPGDMALPGGAVLTLQQAGELRIESAIPARCAGYVRLGDELRARIADPERELRAVVDEIRPAADPATRTVLVKARLPETGGLRPGAFGWLYQACGQDEVLLLPEAAVGRIGQLESVRLVTGEGRPRLRHVRTGKRRAGQVEILSGLEAGDRVLLPEVRR
jgi:RND family efflux transporter MFP subunit